MPTTQRCEGKVGIILWNVKHFSLRVWRISILWKQRAIFGRRDSRWNSQSWHSFTFQKLEHVCVRGFLGNINHILPPLLFAHWCMDCCNKIIINLKPENLSKILFASKCLASCREIVSTQWILAEWYWEILSASHCLPNTRLPGVNSWRLVHYICSMGSKANAYRRKGQWDTNRFWLE